MNLDNLPFACDIALPVHAKQYQLEITLVGNTAHSDSDVALVASDEMLVLFSAAINAQLMNAELIKNVHAQFNLLDKNTHHNNDMLELKYLYDVQNIDNHSFLILLSLLAQVVHAEDPLQHLIIQYKAIEPQSLGTYGLEPFSINNIINLPDNLPFLIENEHEEDQDSCSIAFEFESKITPSIFNELKEDLHIWDHLVVMGGFLFDFQEQEDFSPEFGRTSHYTPTSVEHYLNSFDADQIALNAIINLCLKLHLANISIEHLEIT